MTIRKLFPLLFVAVAAVVAVAEVRPAPTLGAG